MGWMAPLRHLSAKLLSDRNSSEWEPSMGEVTTIGLDLAKHVFQVHGVDAEGATVLRKQLRRAQVLAFFSRLPPCLVGLEACATAHYWGRELRALGHEVRLMPAQYVKAYIKRHAICSLRSRFIVSHRAETNFAFSAKKQKGRPAPCGAAPSSIRAGGHRYPPHRGPDQRNPPSKTDLVFCFCSRRRAGHFCSRLGSKSFRRFGEAV